MIDCHTIRTTLHEHKGISLGLLSYACIALCIVAHAHIPLLSRKTMYWIRDCTQHSPTSAAVYAVGLGNICIMGEIVMQRLQLFKTHYTVQKTN